jgi:hypothetical protein
MLPKLRRDLLIPNRGPTGNRLAAELGVPTQAGDAAPRMPMPVGAGVKAAQAIDDFRMTSLGEPHWRVGLSRVLGLALFCGEISRHSSSGSQEAVKRLSNPFAATLFDGRRRRRHNPGD